MLPVNSVMNHGEAEGEENCEEFVRSGQSENLMNEVSSNQDEVVLIS